MNICEIDWCARKRLYADGYCPTHHNRSLRGTDMDAPIAKWGVNKDTVCKTENCDKTVHARELCKNCYNKWSKGIEPGTGRMKGIYSKNKQTHPKGYIYWLDKNCSHANAHGYVYEHRYVMGEHIGRPLLEHESVHHKNGDRSDNRLENLELWSSSQPYGQRVEDKLAWAKEIIALYGQGI